MAKRKKHYAKLQGSLDESVLSMTTLVTHFTFTTSESESVSVHLCNITDIQCKN